MSYTITIQSAQTVDLDDIVIDAVRDSFEQKRIIARIKGLPRSLILWEGEAEYTAAGNWTNESAQARAVEAVTSGSPRFE